MNELLLFLRYMMPLLVVIAYGVMIYQIGRAIVARDNKRLARRYPQAGSKNYNSGADYALRLRADNTCGTEGLNAGSPANVRCHDHSALAV